MKRKNAPAPAPPVPESQTLRLKLPLGQTAAEAHAALVTGGVATNATTVFDWIVAPFREGPT